MNASYSCCHACFSTDGVKENKRSRTGRERAAKGNRNLRMLGVHLEYVCECGARGWSKNQRMMYLPHNGEVPEGPLFLAEKWRRAGASARKNMPTRKR